MFWRKLFLLKKLRHRSEAVATLILFEAVAFILKQKTERPCKLFLTFCSLCLTDATVIAHFMVQKTHRVEKKMQANLF